MRKALHLCILLANQRGTTRNSYILRVCLIEHLFVRVIPMPLPITHPDRDTKCFWAAQDMRAETQSDLLLHVSLLSRHFGAATMSLKTTRIGDSIRMLTFACMAAICDVVLRKTACDYPTICSLHYSGKAPGPLSPFGIELGNFCEESEYLKFTSPESAAARTQVLDYFHQLKNVVQKDHMMFRFDKTTLVGRGERRFVDQVCLHMGFRRNLEPQYLCGSSSIFLDHYPEIGYFRDLVFMFKLVMVPTNDKLPELKSWEVDEVGLTWSVNATSNQGEFSYAVRGFGKNLDALSEATIAGTSLSDKEIAKPKRGFGQMMLRFVGLAGTQEPRAMPSQANPSILLGENVETEDDVLHVKHLPDFDNTLGAKDCELLLQYLTAPYLRIPLLLNFFSSEDRLKSLRSKALQEILDAAIFEPGQWREDPLINCPTIVPAPDRKHLCTAAGLLFNEIIKCPSVVLSSVSSMLEKIVDMDTGKYSELGDAFLYVVRLAVKVEGYLLFLVRNFEYFKTRTNEALNGPREQAYVRGLDEVTDGVIEEARTCQVSLRNLLDDKIFSIIARWTKRAKKEGHTVNACMLHAHLAFLYRNVDKRDLSPRVIFTMLASQIFLFNNYKYDLDVISAGENKKTSRSELVETSTELIIPQLELFDMYQRNRAMILEWLHEKPLERNVVMNGILRMVQEVDGNPVEDIRDHSWVTVEGQPISFVGKFLPEDEISPEDIETQLDPMKAANYEDWLVRTSTLIFKTEINCQLGEFTIRKNSLMALPKAFSMFEEFNKVFSNVLIADITQCATIERRENRLWVHLVGRPYDLQLWTADTRRVEHGHKQSYFPCREAWMTWARDIIDPWIDKTILGKMDLYIKERFKDSDPDVLELVGYCSANTIAVFNGQQPQASDKAPPPYEVMKEIVIYRYPKVFHVYNVVEYGRRWYRTLIFSSDPMITYHDMKMSISVVRKKTVEISGNMLAEFEPSPSLVITRMTAAETSSAQTYLPTKFLIGLLPTALLSSYSFWQSNVDDSIIGYMEVDQTGTLSRSMVTIRLKKSGHQDITGFGNSLAKAFVTKTFLQEVPKNVAPGTKSNKLEEDFAHTTPDPNKPVLYLVDLMTLLRHYTKLAESSVDEEGAQKTYQAYKDMYQCPEDAYSQHALINLVLRLDSMANILAWSKTDPSDGQPVPIDIIELPRMRLTFERTMLSASQSGADKRSVCRYTCLEQSGLFLVGYNEHDCNFEGLLDGLKRVLLLSNADHEYFALVPALAKPVLLRSKAKDTYVFTTSLSNEEWIQKTGENRYFLFPIHLSGCFIASTSIASSLHLLVTRLMTRKYKEAFHLIDSCVCDSPFTDQEAQIFGMIGTIKDSLFADSHACKLKLFFVTYGCSEIMVYPFSVEEEYLGYVNKLNRVSASCRLSCEEEMFILQHIADNSEARKSQQLIHRERILKSTFDKTMAHSANKSFVPVFPTMSELPFAIAEPIDFLTLEVDVASASQWLKKLAFAQYTRPELASGIPTLKFLEPILFSEKRHPNFFLLYELFAQHLPMQIVTTDVPQDIASLIFSMSGTDGHSGIQYAVLKIMLTHPSLAAKMPAFEDKRRMKLPTFTGLDVYQAHIKAVGSYTKEHMQEISMAAVQLDSSVSANYRHPRSMLVAPTHTSTDNCMDGRGWLNPKLVEYKNAELLLTMSSIPAMLPTLQTFFTREMTFLVNIPMHSIDLRQYVEQKSYDQVRQLQNSTVILDSPQLPVTVLEHPSSQSHIARVSVARLEQDYSDYKTDEKAMMTPVLKAVNGATTLDAAGIQAAAGQVKSKLYYWMAL
jgi:hypothetical protein